MRFKMKKYILFVMSFTAVSCFQSPSPENTASKSKESKPEIAQVEVIKPAPPIVCGKKLITVKNAEVKPKMENGNNWDTVLPGEKGTNWATVITSFAFTSLGVPSLVSSALASALTEGNNPTTREVDESLPDPYLEFRTSKFKFFTPISPNQDRPLWDHKMVVDLKGESTVELVMGDAEFSSSGASRTIMGTEIFPATDFCKNGIKKISFGSVKNITFLIEDYKSTPRRYSIKVPANIALKRTGVEIIQGQNIFIKATGRVCASGNTCSGPDGWQLPTWRSYNIKGGYYINHCSLIMRISPDENTVFGTTPISVGSGRKFKSTSTGKIFFGPNDTDLGNNSGFYNVEFMVW